MRTSGILVLAALLAAPGCGDATGPRPRSEAAVSPGVLRLTDVSATCGVDFRHDAGMSGRRWAVEQLGAGGALFDADGDGDLDLLCLNGGPLPGSPAPKANVLFLNDGRGHFTRAAEIGDLADPEGYAVGCAVADVDADGDLDVLVTRFGEDALFLNEGPARFRRATDSGIEGGGWSASAAFGDLDGDGRPDLYVTRYLDWTLETHEACYRRELEIYCGPQQRAGLPDRVYRNLGGGRFRDVSAEWFASPCDGKGLAVAMGDADGDGDLDVYVANDQTPNFLWINDGRGRLEDVAVIAGVAVSRDGVAEAGMGVVFEDLDGDGDEDLAVTNFEDQTNSLYANEGGGFFLEVSWEAGLGFTTRGDLGWGVVAPDLDLDGRRDLVFANGHVYDNAGAIRDDSRWEQENRIFLGREGLRFVEPDPRPLPLALRRASRGLVTGDIDDDGDPDLVFFDLARAPQVIRNDTVGTTLLVNAIDARTGTPVIGAEVRIGSGGRESSGRVQGARSFLGHSDLRVAFGLAGAPVVDWIEIRWPDGTRHRREAVPANSLVTVDTTGVFTRRPLSGRPSGAGG
ncbi:MAG: CRTAC1 family protein [Planctomycetota bacterium]